MRKSNLYVSVLAIFLLVACEEKDNTQGPGGGKQAPPLKAEAYILRPSPFKETMEVPGSLIAAELVEVHPEVSGRIVQLNLTEGKRVAKGHLIAKDRCDWQNDRCKNEKRSGTRP